MEHLRSGWRCVVVRLEDTKIQFSFFQLHDTGRDMRQLSFHRGGAKSSSSPASITPRDFTAMTEQNSASSGMAREAMQCIPILYLGKSNLAQALSSRPCQLERPHGS